jgi:hypothetical protein
MPGGAIVTLGGAVTVKLVALVCLNAQATCKKHFISFGAFRVSNKQAVHEDA